MEECKECGMHVVVNEYHPYLACLAFKGCHDSEAVRANLPKPTPDLDIEWMGECDLCSGDGHTAEHNHMGCNCGEQQGGPSTCPVQVQCEKCNGTGTITRPATLAEGVEYAIKSLKFSEDDTLHPDYLTINNGTLRCRSENGN